MPETPRISKTTCWRTVPLPPQPPSGRYLFTVDTPCDACGYNLRGLPLDALCPECGTRAILGPEALPQHWPAWVTRRLAGIIASAAFHVLLRLAWLSAGLALFLGPANAVLLKTLAAASLLAGVVTIATQWTLYLSDHRVLTRLHRRRPPRLASLAGMGDVVVGVTILLLLEGLIGPFGAVPLLLLGFVAGTVGAIDVIRRLEGVAFLLQRLHLAEQLRSTGITRCTCELLAMASAALALPSVVFPPILVLVMLAPVGLIAAGLFGLVEIIAHFRLLLALRQATRCRPEPACEQPDS